MGKAWYYSPQNRIKFGIVYVIWTYTSQWGALTGAKEATKGAFKATVYCLEKQETSLITGR